MQPAVLVPVKSFHRAKRRLANVVSATDRERLARWLAGRVVAAAAPLPVFVACDDEHVAQWADELGAAVLWGPGLGLNGAIDHGVVTIAGKGFDHVVIAHGDLAHPARLPRVITPGHVTIVPDVRRDGTNVLSRPTDVTLVAHYGANSFDRHLAAAFASGAPVTVRFDRRLAHDIDTIGDCCHPAVRPLLLANGFEVDA